MHCHVTSEPGNFAHLARSGKQAFAGTTAGAGISAVDQSLEVAEIDECSSALSCGSTLQSKIFELQIDDWVLFPILIIEVPPLSGVNLEILVKCGGRDPFGHFSVATGHPVNSAIP